MPSSDFSNATTEVFLLPPSSSILLTAFDPPFRLTSLTDASTKTPALLQNTSRILKSLLEDNVLLENIAKNVFSLLSEEEKSSLIRKSSQTKQKLGNYITTPCKKKRTEDSEKARKRKSHARISSMASPNPNKDKPDNADEAGSELGDKFEEINSLRMCDISIGPFRIFPCPNSFSKITNIIILKLPDIHLSFDFKILSWSTNLGAQAFQINPVVDYSCSHSPTLVGLDG